MAKYRSLQTNFTAGVLDPKLAAREDIVFYYNGLKSGKNGLVIPQGGFVARPALQYARALSPQLSQISLSGATVTAPEGGTAANLHDNDEDSYATTSGNIGTDNPFVVAKVDHGSAKSVSAVDVVNYKLSAGALAAEFYVQYSTDDMSWFNFGGPFDIDAADRSRRLRNESGPVSARYWRVARIGTTDTAATVSIGEIRFWEETASLSNGKLLPFAYSTEEAYMLVVSDRNADIMKGADYHGSISIPHAHAQLPVLNYTQSLDTMILFHRNVQPWKLFRQGGDDEFDWRYIEFENIPEYDYGAGTGGADEVQTLNDGGTMGTSGDKFTLLLEGYRTTTITVGGSRSATASAIQAALRALANTSSDGITVADASGDGFTVTFGGADGKKPWLEMSVSVMKSTTMAVSVSRTTRGRPEGEAIMSDTRGWPRDGEFWQSRLHLGGITGVPDAWLASVIGDFYNFDTTIDDATRALMVRADTDQVSAIYKIIAGRHLTFFTNDGEFYVPSEKIDQDVVLRWTSDSGSKEGMPVHRADGALLFFQGVKDKTDTAREIATSLREFLYEETLQAYQANLLSKLSGHLLQNPVDSALRKSLSTDEADVEVIINEDGTGVLFTVLREDQVNAFVPMELRAGDKLLAVAVDKLRRVYFLTERQINGSARRYVEIWNEDLYLDCGTIRTMTYQDVTAASAAQAVYGWSFTNPATSAEIGVRINGGRLAADEYSVDLGSKEVTLGAARAAEIEEGDVVRISYMVQTVTGLDAYEGETVDTFIDGSPGEQYTVSGGEITLGAYADTEIQVGFDFEVEGELMPFRVPENQTLSGEEIRVGSLIFTLHETVGLEFQANGGDWQDLPLWQMDGPVLDKNALELLFTGEKKVEGLLGQEVGAPVKFRRPYPGPFMVLGVTREVIL